MSSLKHGVRTRPGARLVAWLSPVLMFALLLAGNISMWRRTADLSDDLTRNQSLNTAEQVALRLENLLQERTNDLALLAGLWGSCPESERAERFLTDATRIVEQEPAYHVINYVDEESIIRLSAPQGKRPELLGLDLTTLPGREALHRQVRDTDAPMASPPMTLTNGRSGTVIWFPIPGEKDDTASSGGMIAGAFHLDEVTRRAVTISAPEEFWIQIELEGTEIYSTETPKTQSTQREETLGTIVEVSLLGRRWRVSVEPRRESTFARLPRENALYFALNIGLSLLASGLLGVAVVATNRVRKSRHRLQQSEVRLRDIFEAAENVSFIMTDLAGTEARILEFSPGAEHIFGYSREEVIGKPMAMLHTPEAVARFPEVFEAIREEKAGFTGESKLIRKSGEQFPALFTTHPISDDRGDVIAAIGVSVDISERVRAEEALRESEQFLQDVFDAIQDGISVLDTDLNVVRTNRWMEQTYAHQMPLVGRKCYRVYQELQTPCPWCPTLRTIKTGETHTETVPYPSADNPTGWIELSAFPIKDEGGRVTRVIEYIKDITDYKRAEEALRESEERFRRAVLESPFPTILHAEDGEVITINEAWVEISGYSKEDISTIADWTEKAYGERKALVKSGIDQLYSMDRRVDEGEYVITTSSGEERTWHFHSAPLGGLPDDRRLVLSIAVDITERKRAEQALRESEERFRKVFEEGPLGMAVLGSDDRFIRVNTALCRMTGYTEEELIGTNYLNITHAEDIDAGRQQAQQLLDGEIPTLQTEKRYITKEGQTLWINLTASFIRDDEGNPLYKLTMIEDITDRKQAEEEIQQRVEELTALNALGRRVGATLSLEQVVQAALEEITGPVDPDLVLLFLREGDKLILQGVGPKGTPYAHQETPVHIVGECLCGLAVSERSTLYSADIHVDPRCTWEECKEAGLRSFAALPMQSSDEIIGVLGLASATERDFGVQDTFLEAMVAQITSGLQNALLHAQIQRHAEELEQRVAERTAELEAKNRELETFTYSVSHDLKAPLRGIDGYSRLLLEDHLDQLDEEGRTFLHTIRRATGRMHQLIEALLTYSRLERRSLTAERINPQVLVESLIAGRADEIEERGTRVTVDIPCAYVVADAESFAQALRNLFENALKFTRETPKPQIEIGGRETEKSCILWVRDNGIGFDMKYHDRIFRIFERLHREEDYPGTGVGLAIVHKAMERIGGRTWAESEPGEGATFYLEIPR